MPDLKTRLLCVLKPAVGPALDLGKTPGGMRRNVPVIGGVVEGPLLEGKIMPGGGDWAFTRPDGVLQLDVRMTVETNDGAFVYVQYTGVRHGPADVLAKLLKGEEVDPSLYYFRVVVKFETSAPAYEHLNRLISVGVGERKATGPEYTVYEIL